MQYKRLQGNGPYGFTYGFMVLKVVVNKNPHLSQAAGLAVISRDVKARSGHGVPTERRDERRSRPERRRDTLGRAKRSRENTGKPDATSMMWNISS